jgi:UDP-2,3-diacylglucosamine hydrolase
MAASAPSAVAPAMPAAFEFSAPADWRAIDFISDLHLCAAMPRTFAAWAAHLRQTPADAVFMLGDLFEIWVGDDSRERGFERECTAVMSEVAGRRRLAFMAGNRDFLVGEAMLGASGMLRLPDPTLLAAWGRRVLLSHGDSLCLDDKPYQTFRQEVRSERWQSDFLNQPLAERLRVAGEIRRASAARQRWDGDSRADVDAPEAVRWMRTTGAAELIHGHTHRPGSNALAPGFERHVLSDWDLDDPGARRAEVLRLTRSGFERLPPAAG